MRELARSVASKKKKWKLMAKKEIKFTFFSHILL